MLVCLQIQARAGNKDIHTEKQANKQKQQQQKKKSSGKELNGENSKCQQFAIAQKIVIMTFRGGIPGRARNPIIKDELEDSICRKE